MNNVLFSDTACCTASFHNHGSFSVYFPGVDSPKMFHCWLHNSRICLLPVCFFSFCFHRVEMFPRLRSECIISSSSFNFLHRVRLVLSLGLISIHLYYYSSPVPDICPHNLTNFTPCSPKYWSDHRVNFYAPTCCLSATFVSPLFAFVLCFFTTKNHHKFRHMLRYFAAAVFALIAGWRNGRAAN